ncbi:hypothetical protein [Rhizobium sp. ZW T2_16]
MPGSDSKPIYALVAVAALSGALSRVTGKAHDVGAGSAAVMAAIDAG